MFLIAFFACVLGKWEKYFFETSFMLPDGFSAGKIKPFFMGLVLRGGICSIPCSPSVCCVVPWRVQWVFPAHGVLQVS